MDSESNSKLDMSLDDIIRMDGIKGPRRFNGFRNNNRRGFNSRPRFNQRSGGGGGGGGGGRFGGFGGNRNRYQDYRNRSTPYNTNNNRPTMRRNRPNYYQPTTLHISNLAPRVTSDDLAELFSSFGNLNKAFVHYDEYGISIGTGEVEFERRDEAIQAKNKLNDIPLDNKPLRIHMIHSNDDDDGDHFTSFLKSSSTSKNHTNNRANVNSRRFNSNNSHNNNNDKIDADDLDRDLDEWRLKNPRISNTNSTTNNITNDANDISI